MLIPEGRSRSYIGQSHERVDAAGTGRKARQGTPGDYGLAKEGELVQAVERMSEIIAQMDDLQAELWTLRSRCGLTARLE